jgi:hypothetical protein
MQGEDIIEHTNGKCHLCTFLANFVDLYVTYAYTS